MAAEDFDRPKLPLPAGFPPERSIVLSASQMSTYAGDPRYSCPRRWWFQKGIDLPEIEQPAQLFGKRLHSVCERFGLADDLGRDRVTQKPVELYPVGWDKGLSPQEADTIQKLIAEAIREGFLSRKAGRLIEHGFIRHLADYESEETGVVHALVTGFIDLLNVEDGEVVDYKTTGRVKNLKSANALADESQMLLYAHELLSIRPDLTTVKLRHVGFVSDPADTRVRDTPAVVSWAKIENAWKEFQELAKDMVHTLTRYNVDEWHEVPSTSSPDSACRRCSYQAICGGSLSPQDYKAIQLRRQKNVSTSTVPPAGKPSVNPPPKPAAKVESRKVYVFSNEKPDPRELEEHAVKADVATETGVHVCVVGSEEWFPLESFAFQDWPAKSAAPPPASKAPQTPMPWAIADCKPCGGSGVSKTGKVCPLCNAKSPADKRSGNYNITTDGSGVMTATRKDGNGAATSTPIPDAAVPPKSEQKTEAPAAPETATTGTVSQPTTQTTGDTTPKPDADTGKAKRGRPAGSFKLFVGIAGGKGCNGVQLSEVVEKHRKLVAAASGVGTFRQCKAFERDDSLIDSIVSKIDEDLGTQDVFCSSPDFEMRKILNALEPLASRTYYGVA